jgi:hypothetical protein
MTNPTILDATPENSNGEECDWCKAAPNMPCVYSTNPPIVRDRMHWQRVEAARRTELRANNTEFVIGSIPNNTVAWIRTHADGEWILAIAKNYAWEFMLATNDQVTGSLSPLTAAVEVRKVKRPSRAETTGGL